MKVRCESGAQCPVDETMGDTCCATCVSVQVCNKSCSEAEGVDISKPDFCDFAEVVE